MSPDVAAEHPWSSRYVSGLNGPRAKGAVVLVWAALGLAGLAVLGPFLDNLVSSIDPVAGTDSFKAAQVRLLQLDC